MVVGRVRFLPPALGEGDAVLSPIRIPRLGTGVSKESEMLKQDTSNVVDFNEALKQRDSVRRDRDIAHMMVCTKQGCLRCQPLDFELRRVARQARRVIA
jgi:hypothetical protein